MLPIPAESASRRTLDMFQIASFVFDQPGCSRTEMQSQVEISATAKSSFLNYLNAAIDCGWVERVGTSKGVTYTVTREFRSEMSLHLVRNRHLRQEVVPYSHDFLRSYTPNEDHYLSPKQLQHIENKGRTNYSFNLRDESVQLAIRRFMTDIAFNSSRLEGIRSNYPDTIAFLEDGIQSDTMSPHDAVILRNHYNTIKMIVDGTSSPPQPNDVGFSEYDIRVIHSQISDGLLKDRKMQGRIRSAPVQITYSRYAPLNNYDVICETFAEMLKKARAIENPFEQSVFISIHLPYLQPFIDCNKRTARVAASIPLLRAGAIPFSWSDTQAETYNEAMVAVYEFNETRPFAEIFTEAYARSCERFEIMMNAREPSRVEVIYAREISSAVRAYIMDDVSIQPPKNASPGHAHSFMRVVNDILVDIVENEMVATPYKIPKNILGDWRLSRQSAASAEASGSIPFENFS